MRSSLLLVVGLLLGAGPATPATPTTPALKPKKDTLPKEIPTITISPGTKVIIRPVKTESGNRNKTIRLETPAVTIEGVCLRIVNPNGDIFILEADPNDGSCRSRKIQHCDEESKK